MATLVVLTADWKVIWWRYDNSNWFKEEIKERFQTPVQFQTRATPAPLSINLPPVAPLMAAILGSSFRI